MKGIQLLAIWVLVLIGAGCSDNSPARPKEQTGTNPIRLPDSVIAANNKGNSYAQVDISPMDMSYYPVDYPILQMTTDSLLKPTMRVIYSRPHLNGRRLFHDVIKYGQPWRLGANEASEIDIYKPVTIQGKRITPGRFIIYCVPAADKWTIVLNSNIDSWGLKLDSHKDLYRFDIPVSHNNPVIEYFTMVFEKTDSGADLVIAWDEVVARLPIKL